MKYIVIIPSGALELPSPAHGDRTPLQSVELPCLGELAQRGARGATTTCDPDNPPMAGACLAGVLGYPPASIAGGSAALFAAGAGVPLGSKKQPLLLDLITISEDVLIDDQAGHISRSERAPLLNAQRESLPSAFVLHDGPDPTQLLVWNSVGSLNRLITRPPETALGEPFKLLLPRGAHSTPLAEIMKSSRILLPRQDVNQVRMDLGENPANAVAIWGAGPLPRVESFKNRFGIRGAMVSAWPIARGLARLLGWFAVSPADSEKNFLVACRAHLSAAVDMLERTDLVCVYIDLPRAAGAHLTFERKCECLRTLDSELLGPLLTRLSTENHWRMLVMPERTVPASAPQARSARTIMVMAGSDIHSNRGGRFDEQAAAEGELRIAHGWELMEYFVRR